MGTKISHAGYDAKNSKLEAICFLLKWHEYFYYVIIDSDELKNYTCMRLYYER